MFYDPKWDKKLDEITKPKELWQEILLKAADILEQKGWCRREFSQDGKHCAVGAINAALNRKPSNDSITRGNNPQLFLQVTQKLASKVPDTKGHLSDIFNTSCYKVMRWNDCLADGEEVISTMRKVAEEG
jgi:hypothetical protein